MKLLGTGLFGRALLVRFISNNQLYAMKILSKNQLKITHQEEHTKTERYLMVKLSSPFLLNYILVSRWNKIIYSIWFYARWLYALSFTYRIKFCEKSKILFNGNNIMIRNFT